MSSATFRCLGYVFTVTADDGDDLAVARRAFGGFTEQVQAEVPSGTYHLGRDPGTGLRHLLVDGRQERQAEGLATGLDYLIWHVNDRAVHAEQERVLLHGGVLAAPGGGALLLPARSGSGKSTTTLGLVQAGFGFLSDEIAVLDPVDARVHPFPRPLSLKAGTLALQPGLAEHALVAPRPGESAFVPATALRADALAGPQHVRWVAFVKYVPGATATLTPLSRATTMLRLAEHTFRFADRHHDAWPTLHRLTQRVDAVTLVTGSLQDSVALLAAWTAQSTDDRPEGGLTSAPIAPREDA